MTLVYGSDDDLDEFPDRDVEVSPQHDIIAGPHITRPPLNRSSEVTQLLQKAPKRSKKSIDKNGNGGAQRKDSRNGSVGNDPPRKRSSGSLSKIRRNSKSKQDVDPRRGSSSGVNKRSSSLEKNVAAGKSRSNSSGGGARVPIKASISYPSHEGVGTATGPNVDDLELHLVSEGYVTPWPAERTHSDSGTLPRRDATSVHSHSSLRYVQQPDSVANPYENITNVYDISEDGLRLQEKDSGLETSRNLSLPLEDPQPRHENSHSQPQSDYYVSRDDFQDSIPQDPSHIPTCFQVGMTEAQHGGCSDIREEDRTAHGQQHRLSTDSQRLAHYNRLPHLSIPSLLSLPIAKGVLAEDKRQFQTGDADSYESPHESWTNVGVGSGPYADPGQVRVVNERMDQIQKQLGDIYNTLDQFLQGGSSDMREEDHPVPKQGHRLSTDSQRLAHYNRLPHLSIPSLLSLPDAKGVLADDKRLFQTGDSDSYESPHESRTNVGVSSGPYADPGQARVVNERMDQIQKQLGDIYNTMDQFLQGVGRGDVGARGADESHRIPSAFVQSRVPQHDPCDLGRIKPTPDYSVYSPQNVPAALIARGKNWASQAMANIESRPKLTCMNKMEPPDMSDMFRKPTPQRTLPAPCHQSRLPGTYESIPTGHPSVSSRVPCWFSYRMPQPDTQDEHEETALSVPLWQAHTSKARIPSGLDARVSKFTESPENIVRPTASAHPQVPRYRYSQGRSSGFARNSAGIIFSGVLWLFEISIMQGGKLCAATKRRFLCIRCEIQCVCLVVGLLACFPGSTQSVLIARVYINNANCQTKSIHIITNKQLCMEGLHPIQSMADILFDWHRHSDRCRRNAIITLFDRFVDHSLS